MLQEAQVQAHDDKLGMFPTAKKEKTSSFAQFTLNAVKELKVIIYKVFNVFTTALSKSQI